MTTRRVSMGLLLLGVVLGASCIVPESDTYPDGVRKSAYFAVGGAGGVGGASPVCGDGAVDMSTNEACDDGNVTAGDGCDDVCVVESCFTCPAGGGACSLSAAGTDCPTDATQVCDGQGACVACLPIGTTCAGPNCRFCDGAPCTGAVGECASGSCADGFCCNAACGGECQACDFPGLGGTCLSPVPDGWQEGACTGTNACQGGTCGSLMNKAPTGGFCANDAACANGTCVGGVCRLKKGDACGEHAQCETNFCGGDKTCSDCVMDAECSSGTCLTGVCLAGGGEPCGEGLDCVSGSSCNAICKLSNGTECQFDYQCTSNLCAMGMCAKCDMTQVCNNAAMCFGGMCLLLLPTDALCSAPADCESMQCTGFPPRCG